MYTGNTKKIKILVDNIAVYPCVYREHDLFFSLSKTAPGLSLCIQGTRFLLKIIEKKQRFIPVYTGNTFMPGKRMAVTTVYPCVYREH